MMQVEFERLMGYSDEELRLMGDYDRERNFKEAEECYMLLRNVWKQEFCAVWKVKRLRWMVLGFCRSWSRSANRMQQLSELELFSEGVRLQGEALLKKGGMA